MRVWCEDGVLEEGAMSVYCREWLFIVAKGMVMKWTGLAVILALNVSSRYGLQLILCR